MKKIIFIFTAAVFLILNSGFAAYDLDKEYIPGWTDNSKDPLGVLQYTVGIVEKDGRESVLKLEMQSERADNTIVSFRQELDPGLLKEGHTYKLEMDYTAEALNPTWILIRFGTEWGDMSEPYTPNITGWQHRTMSYTITDLSKTLFVELQCQHNSVTFYADSIKVYDEADENKTNLLINGDFDAENEGLSINNIKAEKFGEEILLTWDAPSELIKKVSLYNGGDMSQIEISDNSARFEEDSADELIFEIEDIYGGIREQKKYLSDIFNGNFSESIVGIENGKIKASVSVKNEVEKTAVVMAVYKDGRLLGSSHVWRKSEKDGNTDEIELFYTPESAGVYEVKLFLLDSLSGINPLSDAGNFRVEIF